MKIIVTARELIERGSWVDACKLTGTNPWAVSEGLMTMEDELTLTEPEAAELELIALPAVP